VRKHAWGFPFCARLIASAICGHCASLGVERNVRTPRSRSWSVQSCERSVSCEDRNPVADASSGDGRASLTVSTSRCARWASVRATKTERRGRAPQETLRSQLCTAPERNLGVLTFLSKGLTPAPSHHSPEDRRTGPPTQARPSRVRAPCAPLPAATGPRCAQGGADRRFAIEARCPQIRNRSVVPADSQSKRGART